jgi:hypothetical protein
MDKGELLKQTICGKFNSSTVFNGDKIKIKLSLKGGEENIVEFECRFADSL